MLCLEEATVDDVPLSLKSLISSLPPDSFNAKEIFTVILYIVSIESGFTWNIELEDIPLHHRTYSFDVRRIRSIPTHSYDAWSTTCDNFEKILYLGGVEDFKCKLVATPWMNNMVVHISSAESLLCFSSIYIVPDYIQQSVPKFEKLKELITKLRNDLFHPMRSYILTEASIANPSSLGLPIEIIVKIVRYLSVKDFLNLCSTCEHFYTNLSELDSVWHFFSKKYALAEKLEGVSWKTHFIKNVSI